MKDLKSALLLFVLLTVICGGIYPAVVTGIAANLLFPNQAEGSLHHRRQRQGDRFHPHRPALFRAEILLAPALGHRRFCLQPAAFGRFQRRPDQSRLDPRRAKERVAQLRRSGIAGEIPADLVLASASGLDPHISPEAAQAADRPGRQGQGNDRWKSCRELSQPIPRERQVGRAGSAAGQRPGPQSGPGQGVAMSEPQEEMRPSPEAMLKAAQAEEQEKKRGRLKIFLGYAAGVGKTYAMLKAAGQQQQEGRDVVAAYVESHGRPETDALLEGLEIHRQGPARIPGGAAAGTGYRCGPGREGRRSSWWTNWPIPTSPAPATKNAGRTSRSCWPPASMSTPRSMSSTSRASTTSWPRSPA